MATAAATAATTRMATVTTALVDPSLAPYPSLVSTSMEKREKMCQGNLTDEKREAPFLHFYFCFRWLPVAALPISCQSSYMWLAPARIRKKNRIVVLRSSDRHGTHQQRIGYTRWSVFFCVNVYRHQRYSKADVGPRSIGICFKKSNCLLTRTVNIQWLNCIIRCESGRTFFGYNLRNRKHERVQVARLLDVGSVNPACRDGGHLP